MPRQSSRFVLLALGVFGALGLASAGCRDQGGTFTPKPDGGSTSTLTCNSTPDCQGRGICMGGVCEAVTSCQTDDQCTAEGKVCHSSRKYCVQCDGRHTNECPQGQTCQFDFTCVAIGPSHPDGGSGDAAPSTCSGSCSDRTQCGQDQVCTNHQCCPPPSRCTSVADCPQSRPTCNGATGQCFGGQSCAGDNDCNTHTGCQNGACICDHNSGTCVPRPDECQTDADCFQSGHYAGKYCTIATPPKRCVNAPGCSTDADCIPHGLVCDLTAGSPSLNKCKNGTLCPTGNECNPTTEVCQSQVCVRKNCLNTPSLCNATQRCDAATGMCVANSTGTCTNDSDCTDASRYCNTTTTPGTCTVGCRSSASCGANQVCDANHQCQASAGAICADCQDSSECPAGAICGLISHKCVERCNQGGTPECTIDPSATCNAIGFCGCP